MKPACVPFETFTTSAAFLATMERHVELGDGDPEVQLFDDMPILRRRYAVVCLEWSKVEFVIRRHRDEDLHALNDRVGCAWRAKERGDFEGFEFLIRVTLKMEELM